jgi:uracil phosphoribosyltransferase
MDNKITVVGKRDSIFNRFMSELRSEEIQGDRMRFRTNIRRCSQIMAYEVSKAMSYSEKSVTTPLGELEMRVPQSEPVIVSILRAGVSMHNGFLDFFDMADNGFISAYRHHTHGNEFIVKVEYAAIPRIDDRTLILVDPMIATGKSLVLSYEAIVPSFGTPDKVILAGIIASEEGLEYVRRKIPKADIYVGAVDKELTGKAYIVPGLGDAGDLAYGAKE